MTIGDSALTSRSTANFRYFKCIKVQANAGPAKSQPRKPSDDRRMESLSFMTIWDGAYSSTGTKNKQDHDLWLIIPKKSKQH